MATQDSADFLSGRNAAAQKYALEIINNRASIVLSFLESRALKQVSQVVKLSQAELDLLRKLRRDEKLIISVLKKNSAASDRIEVPIAQDTRRVRVEYKGGEQLPNWWQPARKVAPTCPYPATSAPSRVRPPPHLGSEDRSSSELASFSQP